MDCSSTRVIQLGKVMQEHCRGGNVLTSPSELQGIGPPNQGVALGLMGTTLSTARWSMRLGRSVVRRAHWCSWWLMQPLLS